MSSSLIILIGFVVSAILMLTVWLVSKNVQGKRRIQEGIEKQKADITSLIEEAINDDPPAKKARRGPSSVSPQPGLLTWGKWFMVLAWLRGSSGS
jgi:uncharacterized membrane protein YccC